MALIKTSNEIETIRGRFGGVYFKTGPDGKHVQAMPRTVRYTRSAAQKGGYGAGLEFSSFGIDGFSSLASLWMLALLAFFSAAWAAYALVFYFTTKTGERKRITGYNWYIHYGLAFPECERPAFWKPPHSPGDLPDLITVYKGRWTYEHPPTEWPADCCSGYFWEGIEWNGKPSYKTDDVKWLIWWNGIKWVLSPGLGYEPAGLTFYEMTGAMKGYYWNPVTKKYAHVYAGKPPE